ncbi:NETI motif-containing protein [Alkalihalobacterium chitinilyticum]|uniref:NETI motif-containing protein n=1 Tax=Alkalihalobacterium chitinilyticum TaxID=2980103 RepID=A0ABT5VIV1_9BACI|nr:NETI motif-containing protein [Alkalihalobacterium chitinilyticum]MDE5415185.1 NETI motif-containing protein [Alkalihalobacterium chitinilyticum]
MSNKRKKLRFEVGEKESITQCLERMDKEGYRPTRRMEEPVFQEISKNGKTEVVPVRQKIIFEGTLKEEE